MAERSGKGKGEKSAGNLLQLPNDSLFDCGHFDERKERGEAEYILTKTKHPGVVVDITLCIILCWEKNRRGND